jgi:hypothetical protein
MKFKKSLVTIISLLAFNASAGTVQIGALLDSVAIIGPTAFGHQAGNMEIKVTNGFSSPSLSCDSNYITTKNSVPNFKEIYAMLLAAQLANRPVMLGVTDDPALTAFGGRCSIVSVSIAK